MEILSTKMGSIIVNRAMGIFDIPGQGIYGHISDLKKTLYFMIYTKIVQRKSGFIIDIRPPISF